MPICALSLHWTACCKALRCLSQSTQKSTCARRQVIKPTLNTKRSLQNHASTASTFIRFRALRKLRNRVAIVRMALLAIQLTLQNAHSTHTSAYLFTCNSNPTQSRRSMPASNQNPSMSESSACYPLAFSHKALHQYCLVSALWSASVAIYCRFRQSGTSVLEKPAL